VRALALAGGLEAKAGISDWILFYNERRVHQALGYRVPMAVWREGRLPKGYRYLDTLTTCIQADQKQRTEPWRFDKGQPADAIQT
jgi:putative transposase